MSVFRFPAFFRSWWLRLAGFLVGIFLFVLAGIGILLRQDSLNRNLIDAVRAGNVQGVEQALRAGADPNACDDARNSFWDRAGWEPVLMYAIEDSSEHPQSEAIVRMLLEAGADVHEKSLLYPGDTTGSDAVSIVKPREEAPPLPPGVVTMVMKYANRK